MNAKISLDGLIPGGIKPSDKVHHITNDGKCSRCGKDTADEVPLMLWIGEAAEDMLIYCQACVGDSDD